MLKKILLFFFLYFYSYGFSQTPNLTENSKVSVFTCGSGGELYSVFGHTAIRITDEAYNLDVVFNYGAFDFNTENFYLKFVKGDLNYFIGASSYADFIAEYYSENRNVVEQTLRLSLQQKQELADNLTASLYNSERTYQYKFIDRNCTTMVTDKINQTLGSAILQKIDSKTISYREVLYPYFQDHFWYKLGINFIFGYQTDTDASKLFLPIELLHSLEKAQYQNTKLVSKTENIIVAKKQIIPFSFFNSIWMVLLVLVALILINNNKLDYTYILLLGILGMFFSLVGWYSFHKEILWNYNVLLFNPILLLVPFVRNKKSWIDLAFVLLLVYVVFLLNKPHLLLALPFIATSSILLFRIRKRNQLLPAVK